MQDKGSCGLGGACLLTGQVGGLAATATRSDEGHSQAHFTPFQSYSSITSPLSAALKRGLCRPDLHDSAPSDRRRQECFAGSPREEKEEVVEEEDWEGEMKRGALGVLSEQRRRASAASDAAREPCTCAPENTAMTTTHARTRARRHTHVKRHTHTYERTQANLC